MFKNLKFFKIDKTFGKQKSCHIFGLSFNKKILQAFLTVQYEPSNEWFYHRNISHEEADVT